MPSPRKKKETYNADVGETVEGKVVGVRNGDGDHEILIEDQDCRVWFNLRGPDYQATMQALGPNPLGSTYKVKATMGRPRQDETYGPYADSIAVYKS